MEGDSQGGREVLSLLLGEKAVWPPGGNVTAVVNPGATLEAVLDGDWQDLGVP